MGSANQYVHHMHLLIHKWRIKCGGTDFANLSLALTCHLSAVESRVPVNLRGRLINATNVHITAR